VSFNKIYVFTDFDIDGVAALLALHWALGAEPGQIAFKTTTVTNFRKEYLNWLNENNPNDFDKIYILDLDVAKNADLVDRKNIVIIDHHLTHVNALGVYKNAEVHVSETSSCAKKAYNHFKTLGKLTKLTQQQKYFIALADDYDCYQFKLPETYELNCLYTNTQKTSTKQRAEIFLEKYYNGFYPFTTQEKAIIKEYVDRKNKAIDSLEIYQGTVSIGGAKRTIYGTHGTKFVNEICDYMINTHPADIVFFVNSNNSHVSFRKNKSCDVDLSKLAAKICEGGGHEYAAGGKVTETFLNFTKLLTPLT
jgi:oligoribonuclease NrnB/cAMP/cGMP phosphodiesterase (DHH superfamily)